jgi:hypothetical protein
MRKPVAASAMRKRPKHLSGWNRTAQEYTGLETLTRLPPELERLTSLQA